MVSIRRGLSYASQKIRDRVASAGGRADHAVRGLAGASQATRERVARAGGRARNRRR